MAKVTGPLMSMDASGAFGGTLVFTKWKGRPVVRQLVKPSNPQSFDQEYSRNILRIASAGQHWANTTAQIYPGQTVLDKIRLRDAAPSGQAWNGFFVKSLVGVDQSNFDAAEVAWTQLAPSDRTAWDTAASQLVPAIPAVAQFDEGHVPLAPISAGNVFFQYVNALFKAGLVPQPGATPPAYA